MAIGKAEKAAYNDEVKVLKQEIDVHSKKGKELAVKKQKMSNISSYYNIDMISILINIIKKHLEISDISLEMLHIKNNKSLDNAKSDFSKIMQLLKEIVGDEVDRPLTENDEYLHKIDRLNPKHILEFSQRIESTFVNLKNKMGEDSKWKWLFVEFQAKIAVGVKNITSFSDIAKYRDPRVEFFYDRQEMMRFCKDGLADAAKQYRTKYEVAGKAREDLKRSIELLAALRKIHVLFGEDEEATKLKNTIDANKQALEADDKAKDKKSKEKGSAKKKKKK